MSSIPAKIRRQQISLKSNVQKPEECQEMKLEGQIAKRSIWKASKSYRCKSLSQLLPLPICKSDSTWLLLFFSLTTLRASGWLAELPSATPGVEWESLIKMIQNAWERDWVCWMLAVPQKIILIFIDIYINTCVYSIQIIYTHTTVPGMLEFYISTPCFSRFLCLWAETNNLCLLVPKWYNVYNVVRPSFASVPFALPSHWCKWGHLQVVVGRAVLWRGELDRTQELEAKHTTVHIQIYNDIYSIPITRVSQWRYHLGISWLLDWPMEETPASIIDNAEITSAVKENQKAEGEAATFGVDK